MPEGKISGRNPTAFFPVPLRCLLTVTLVRRELKEATLIKSPHIRVNKSREGGGGGSKLLKSVRDWNHSLKPRWRRPG